jgi:hypothetical protein
MTDAAQPVAGSLSATVLRACTDPQCPHRGTVTCPQHARTEDLGEIASLDIRGAARGEKE